MRVLVVHNHYRTYGGEDTVFDIETRLLEDAGVDVIRFEAHNDDIAGQGHIGNLVQAFWSKAAYAQVRTLCADRRPDIMHVHNTYARLSPSVFHAARAAGVATVMTVHNYRLGCPAGQFFRQGHICEDCKTRLFPWPGVLHGCHEGDRQTTLARALVYGGHWGYGTWRQSIDRYIALTEFSAAKLVEIGLPARQIALKPNALHPDPGEGGAREGFMLFVGRLEAYKGVDTLLEVWGSKEAPSVPLVIVGSGSLATRVEALARRSAVVTYLGQRSHEDVLDLMGRATALVFPSIYYESCPMTIVESFARGTPVIAARLGAAGSMVSDNSTGITYEPGSSSHLRGIMAAVERNTIDLAKLGNGARRQFELLYSGKANVRRLLQIYDEARFSRRA